VNITIITGSNRKVSASTRTLRYIARLLEDKGNDVTIIDLWENPLPFYSPDDDYSQHPLIANLLQSVESADGLVFGTPEYHGSVSGVLKNALDFMGASQVSGKPVLSVSTSGGAVGVSSLTQMQAMVRNLHGINSPEWISLGGDARKFDEEGVPIDEKVRLRIDRSVNLLIKLAQQLKGE